MIIHIRVANSNALTIQEMIMSRKNAFLFILLFTTSSIQTESFFNFSPGAIAKCEVIASAALMTCGFRYLEEIYNINKETQKSWPQTLKDSRAHIDLSCAALLYLLGGYVFNDACSRLGIKY